MSPALPQSLQANPSLERWIRLTAADGRRGVRIAIGKVELGQGILTAIAQIAADVGYQSEAALSRAFHRHYGVRPGALRALGAG